MHFQEVGEVGEGGDPPLEMDLQGRVLVFCNITNKIHKRTDTAVAFTQEYSRVLYPLRNVSTLHTGSGCPRTHTGVGG